MTRCETSRGFLAARAVLRLCLGLGLVLVVLLLSAGTVAYMEAWAYVGVLFLPVTLVLVHLLVNDPELLERRLRSREADTTQGRIVRIGSAFCVMSYVAAGLDRRFGWSHVPVAAVIAANSSVLLGYLLFVRVLRENRFASRVIEVVQGQRVVTTGPYALVRHPMYLAALVMFLFSPVALGSWWAVLAALPLVAVLVARIRHEERQLVQELDGYEAYTRSTRFRLIPGVW